MYNNYTGTLVSIQLLSLFKFNNNFSIYHSFLFLLPIYTWADPEKYINFHDECGHFPRTYSTERPRDHTESKLLVSSLLFKYYKQIVGLKQGLHYLKCI